MRVFFSTKNKKAMKKLLLLCLICAGLSASAQTYKKRTPEEKAKYYTEEMDKEIGLDETQKVKIFDINVVVSQQFDSLFATKPDAETKRKGSIGIYKQRDAAYRKVLTTKQFLMFDDIQREKRAQKMKERAEKEKAENEKVKLLQSTQVVLDSNLTEIPKK